MKEIKRRVDHHLPKWLHSKILTAVDFIWTVKNDEEKTMQRMNAVASKISEEEMTWVMMLLTLPKLHRVIMKGEDYKEFEATLKERTVH